MLLPPPSPPRTGGWTADVAMVDVDVAADAADAADVVANVDGWVDPLAKSFGAMRRFAFGFRIGGVDVSTAAAAPSAPPAPPAPRAPLRLSNPGGGLRNELGDDAMVALNSFCAACIAAGLNSAAVTGVR